VLFHRKYQTGDSTDIMLRSGLISALYNYAAEVENDAIDLLQMSKVTLFFKKREHPVLFVFFIESTINPLWCETEINQLLEAFFQRYPELLWQREILDLSIFESFKTDADKILTTLGKKIEVLLFLIEEGLITEEEYLQEELGTLGRTVADRILEKQFNLFKEALGKDKHSLISLIDKIILQLHGECVTREGTTFIVECEKCSFHQLDHSSCFFEELIQGLANSLRLDSILIEIVD
jgi:hypothetical protein